jgi:hypothetical protein
MKVPVPLSEAFGPAFEELLVQFASNEGLIPPDSSMKSDRFLARSIVPHIEKLSSLFNRIEGDQSSSLAPYWKESSNPANLRLAYLLYFMPANLFRVAGVWAELARLGYRWPAHKSANFRAVEFGAGPASGACGIAAGEQFAPLGLPKTGNWALIEQDKATLELGASWANAYFKHTLHPEWETRTFHRKLLGKAPEEGLLPPTAPRFHLWVMSYFLNELEHTGYQAAKLVMQAMEDHLEDEGLVLLIEPALKLQSRRLLEFRKEWLKLAEKKKESGYRVLLPCLGHQACGALAAEEDWCHEEVTWWRPPYYRKLDQLAHLDRKTLPFSYLVLTRSKKTMEELLPTLSSTSQRRYRLVSPAHNEGRDQEFFVCGQEGKRRARYRAESKKEVPLERGDILSDTDIQGDVNSSRIRGFTRTPSSE